MFPIIKLLLIVFVSVTNCDESQTDWELNQIPITRPESEFYGDKNYTNIEEAIKDTRLEVEQWKSQNEIPGVVAGVSVKGKEVWTEGFGYTDIENGIKTSKDSVFRIASISKSITSGLVAKLIDEGKLDLNRSIFDYLPNNLLPKKKWKGIEVNITLRQVMSHMAGFRVTKVPDDFLRVTKAENVTQTIEYFRNDELLFEPGKNFSYSNYGYQVVGAVIETTGKGNPYETKINKLFEHLDMNSTTIDRRENIVLHRSRYYEKKIDSNNVTKVVNADIIDDLTVYEGWWSAGGVISTVSDLLRFGNAMLTSFIGKEKGFWNSSTIKELWTPETQSIPRPENLKDVDYAKGWYVTKVHNSTIKQIVWHAGGFLGASSLLYIIPEQEIVAVVFSNLGYPPGMNDLLLSVAKKFVSF